MSDTPSISELTLAFARNHPAEMASFLAAEHGDRVAETVLALPAPAAAAVVSQLPSETAATLLAEVSDAAAAGWISAGSVAEAVNIVLRLAPERREGVLQGIADRMLRHRIERLVVYPRRTLGALADATVMRLNADTPLEEAVTILRTQDRLSQQPVWVVETSGRFLGRLDMARALLASKEGTQIRDCLDPIQPLLAESSLLAAHDDPLWLHHLALPVVDYDGHLLGHVTREQLLQVLSEDAPPGDGVGDAVTGLASQYLRFLSVCMSDLLQGRPPQ